MKYTARNHAFVYGVIAQEILAACEGAPEILEKAIRTYGLQRGSRMGQTAEQFGDPRTMQMYLAYGEWAPAPGEMDVRVPEETPSAVWNVHRCPWHQEWEEKGMLEAGRYYCQFVDRELVHGFNPELELGTGTTQTNGDEFCYFKWTGADMTPEHKEENAAVAAKVGTVRLKTWAYHMGHIYKTMKEILTQEAGAEMVAQVYAKADARIAESLGQETVELMHAGLVLDYWTTPSLKKMELLSQMFQVEV
ncbi:MAG: L-2-amino-thiazoline-4-carboxylic acid hydrolase [Lachnospiraceae bacterium]|nr:L-2-amino-thiazoline-4-carboxylic acid hydrolase [Lachnospiraceae bacterium]